jgi:hypothetical protein
VESTRIESLVRSLTESSSRRGLLRGASVTALALAAMRLPLDAEAKNKKKGKKKKKKKKTQPVTPAPPPSPVTRADALCPGAANDAVTILDVNARIAQTFTAIASGPLVRAEVRVIKPPATLGDFILRLAPVDGSGVPTNIVLAETPLLDINVPNGPSTVSFTFANPASVVAGTTYALVLTRSGSDQLAWGGKMGDGCTGTAFLSPSQSAPFAAVGGLDLIFATFVTS